MNPLNFDEITAMAREPVEESAYETWLEQKEVVSFLERDAAEDNIIVYASLPHVFLHAILIPQFEINDESTSKLQKWNFNAATHWSLVGSRTNIGIEGPLGGTHIPLVEGGEKIVFVRFFDGYRPKATYYELNQKISQILNIHYLDERNAWCDLDECGDIDEIAKVHTFSPIQGDEPCTVISIRRERLAEYATAGGYTLLRMFDLTRFRPNHFSGFGNGGTKKSFGNGKSIFGTISQCGPAGSYSRGIQLVDLAETRAAAMQKFFGSRRNTKFETFIAHDWRHKVIDEFSCDPMSLSNYFQPTDHPYEMSPAFFNPEVLSKYKAAPEKYTIEARSISCRGGWYLKAYGVNDANQVHAYLGYLADLPFSEQLHWKQFNEQPKAPLSASVIATDFEGRWDVEYDPLVSLLQRIRKLHGSKVDWWHLRNTELLKRVHLPLTDNCDDWASELMNLDQLLVEGLEERWLRAFSKKLGRSPDDRFRGLKLVEECLCGFGFEANHAREIMSPWHVVHTLRSELKGHASTSIHEKERDVRKSEGSLKNHFVNLCTKLDESLRVVSKAFDDWVARQQ